MNGFTGTLETGSADWTWRSKKAKETLQYVQVRHEEMAAFMASAHAKFTGEVGLCYATSGPGAIHLLNGLYEPELGSVLKESAKQVLASVLPGGKS